MKSIPVEEQVAIIYTGINGFLDDIEVSKVRSFVDTLRTNLRNSKPKYAEIVRDTKQFSSEAEELLKEVIASTKSTFA